MQSTATSHFFFFNFGYNFLPQKFRKLSLQQKIPRVRRIYTDYQRELLIKEYLSHIILVGSEKMIRDPRQLCHNKISNTNSMPKAKKRQIKDNANNYAKLLEAIPDISDLVAVTDAVLFLISESHAKRNLNFLANSGLNIDLYKKVDTKTNCSFVHVKHICFGLYIQGDWQFEVTKKL